MVRANRVLVAEDEPDTLRGLERVIARRGYSVVGANGGPEAARKLRSESFDAVVSDLRMPKLGGMDLLRLAKKKDQRTVFVMITGYGTPENAVEAMRLGSSDYIAKPFSPDELMEAIERGLKGRAPASTPPSPAQTVPSDKTSIQRFPHEHAWASVQPDGTITVGADESFFEEAKEVAFCDLPAQGEEIEKGQPCARTVNTTGFLQKTFSCPLSGRVLAVNQKMEHQPGEAQGDPRTSDWLLKILPSRLNEELRSLERYGTTSKERRGDSGSTALHRWREHVWAETHHLDIAPALTAVIKMAGDSFSARLRFVESHGGCESYIPGDGDSQPAQCLIPRIFLYGGVYLMPESWGTLSHRERTRLVRFLRALVFGKLVPLW